MNSFSRLPLICGLLNIAHTSFADSASGDQTPAWVTNGPAVFIRYSPPLKPTDPVGLERKTFQYYFPGSLSHLIWTNFTAHTNGREMLVWSTRTHPTDWPAHPPQVVWNPKSLIWGMKGITALSPCWQVESGIGQVPVTALTRRHAYTRGHGMGPDGLNENFAGKKIWFVTTNNTVVEATVLRNIVRTYDPSKRDYTILLFNRDLPPSIQPLRVVSMKEMDAKYPPILGAPRPIFKTEQLGNVSTDIEPLKVNTWKGGDSGSPNLLPMPGELFFFSGRSTSEATAEMQADIDQLSKSARLDPKKYQLQWLDLRAYPAF
jgi:hypothetical protein